MDNFSGHGSVGDNIQSDDGQICLMFLPANTTAVIQPMDQNPIRSVKLKYRSILLGSVVARTGEGVSIVEMLKKHTLKDAIILLNEAWKNLPESIIANAWKPLFNWKDNDFDEEDLLPLIQLRDQSFAEIVEEAQMILNEIGGELTTEEIMNWNNDLVDPDTLIDAVEGSSDDDVEDVEMTTPKILHSDALQSVGKLLKWCEENGQNTTVISSLINVRTQIVEAMMKKQTKQLTITECFNKN